MKISLLDFIAEVLKHFDSKTNKGSFIVRWPQLPHWIKYRVLQKLAWLYSRRWRARMTTTPARIARPFQDVSNTRTRLTRHDAYVTPDPIFKTPCRKPIKGKRTTQDENAVHCTKRDSSDAKSAPVCSDVFVDGFRVPKDVTPKALVFLNQVPHSLSRRRRSTTFSPGFIDSRRYEIVALLGSGGFGSVYKALYKGQMYAVKKLHPYTKNERAKFESYKAETLAKKLKHRNIVRIFAASDLDHPGGAVIVMEYAGRQNLQQMIFDQSQELDLKRCIKFGLHIAGALDFIHQNQIIHLDLKPANIMVTDADVCKVGDFGCCQVVEVDTGTVSPTQRSYLTGTFAYRAPELLRGNSPRMKADVYSLGITLWQMRSREMPYTGDHHAVIFAVVAYSLRPTIQLTDDPVESGYQKLFTDCWAAKPYLRPTAKDASLLLKKLSMCSS